MSRSSLWSLIGLTLVIPAGFEFRGASCPAQEFFAETVEAVPVDELLIHPSIPISEQDLSLEVDAWWLDQSLQSLRADATTLPVTLESLLVRAVTHSSQIKVFSELPLIRRTAITEADAAFDPAAFLDSRWDDTNDPVGSTLTGVPIGGRYKNNQFTTAVGVRKRTHTGGLAEASQQFGVQDTNSAFFTPNPQGTTRLKLSYTHPLLRGNGTLYNVSLSCLAMIDTDIAEAEFSRELQSHLTEVARAYWGLHIARASVAIQQTSLSRATEVLDQLRSREGIDAVRAQVLRAEAEVAARESLLLRALMSGRTSEARIRSLVNDPALGSWQTTELITLDAPNCRLVTADLQSATTSALTYRPEVHQALDQIRAGCVRLRMSKQEMLPVLNAVTEAYVAGLQNDASVGDSWTDQFHRGRPGYAVGLEFEQPVGNRAAIAQRQRRILECRQLTNQYETMLHSLRLEVGVAVRELEASWQETVARQTAMEAHRTQLESTVERWKLLPGEDGTGSLVMESMLRDQDRLARAEIALLESWISYNMSLFGLRKATGELLTAEQVSWVDFQSECTGRERVVRKPDLGDSPVSLPDGGVFGDHVSPSRMVPLNTPGTNAAASKSGPQQ